jgi:hypothetical protein
MCGKDCLRRISPTGIANTGIDGSDFLLGLVLVMSGVMVVCGLAFFALRALTRAGVGGKTRRWVRTRTPPWMVALVVGVTTCMALVVTAVTTCYSIAAAPLQEWWGKTRSNVSSMASSDEIRGTRGADAGVMSGQTASEIWAKEGGMDSNLVVPITMQEGEMVSVDMMMGLPEAGTGRPSSLLKGSGIPVMDEAVGQAAPEARDMEGLDQLFTRTAPQAKDMKGPKPMSLSRGLVLEVGTSGIETAAVVDAAMENASTGQDVSLTVECLEDEVPSPRDISPQVGVINLLKQAAQYQPG